MTGFYLMHRGWLDSPVFAKEAFTEREAWIWLIENAVHCDTNINIKGRRQFLKRGQLSFSIRFLAEKWAWNKSRVSRFLEKLKKWDMVETVTETLQIVVTICKYEDYQGDQSETETVREAKPRQERDNSETKKKQLKTIKTNNNILDTPDDVEEQVWLDFIEQRKAKKAPITPTVLSQIRKEAGSAGWTLNDALKEICARNWQTFKAEWIKDFKNGTSKSTRSEDLDRAAASALAKLNEQYMEEPANRIGPPVV